MLPLRGAIGNNGDTTPHAALWNTSTHGHVGSESDVRGRDRRQSSDPHLSTSFPPNPRAGCNHLHSAFSGLEHRNASDIYRYIALAEVYANAISYWYIGTVYFETATGADTIASSRGPFDSLKPTKRV